MEDQIDPTKEQNSKPSEEEKIMSAEEIRAEARQIYQEVLEESRRMAQEENL